MLKDVEQKQKQKSNVKDKGQTDAVKSEEKQNSIEFKGYQCAMDLFDSSKKRKALFPYFIFIFCGFCR